MSSPAELADKPIYGPFFGVMGAASAIIFSGKCDYFVSVQPHFMKNEQKKIYNWTKKKKL